jgi:IMP and pyridine-specific 5'-nucleotidase
VYILHSHSRTPPPAGPEARLEFVPPAEWQLPEMLAWTEADVTGLLDDAERALRAEAQRLALPVDVIRKPRACGVVPTGPVIYETLEEIALACQARGLGQTSGPG